MARPQFSLRMLLVVVTVSAAMAAAWRVGPVVSIFTGFFAVYIMMLISVIDPKSWQ